MSGVGSRVLGCGIMLFSLFLYFVSGATTRAIMEVVRGLHTTSAHVISGGLERPVRKTAGVIITVHASRVWVSVTCANITPLGPTVNSV